MGIGIHCLVEPELPRMRATTDGKNLARAFITGTLKEANVAADDSVFAPLTPLLGTLSTGEFTWHEPAAGLVALADVIRRLQTPGANKSVPDAALREACIWDLEQFVKVLQEAENIGSSFSLVFDV